ncbi:MAG: hypothetical protein IPK82_04505 [Polyangiaceae bacterium]|nr:hypothetical protein [Polyangiaceae bacterium]
MSGYKRWMKAAFCLVGLSTIAACGGGGVWAPPPTAAIPVAPRPDEIAKRPMLGSASSKQVAAAVLAAPEPISGALPKDIDAKLVTHAVCKDRECLVAGLFPSGAAADGGAPVAIWSHDLPEKNTSLTFPRHSGVDLFGLVLSGKVKVRPLEAAAKSNELGQWGIVRAPGAGISIEAVDGAARLVIAIVGDSAPIAETAALLKDRKNLKKVAWSSRPSSIEVKDLNSVNDLTWGGGAMHARLGFEVGRASFGILYTSKDAPVAAHVHEASWEILAPLWGDGTARKAAAAGATELMETAITDGMVVAIPKGTLHAWVPAKKKPLLAVQLYLPPGPEQRFKKNAADAAAAPAPAK